jgi:hypothetical protein
MGLFADIKGKTGSSGGQYLSEGLYVVQVERCKQDVSKKQDHKPYFAAELKVLESNNEEIKVGTSRSFVVKFKGEYPELDLGNVADFMNAAMKSWFVQQGMPVPDGFEVDEETAEDICGEENVLAGTILPVEVQNIKTKKQNDFSKHKWGLATPELLARFQ